MFLRYFLEISLVETLLALICINCIVHVPVFPYLNGNMKTNIVAVHHENTQIIIVFAVRFKKAWVLSYTKGEKAGRMPRCLCLAHTHFITLRLIFQRYGRLKAYDRVKCKKYETICIFALKFA